MARKAAALLHSMVGNHGFVDANKRTAWILVGILLERSGYRLAVQDDERIDDPVVAVAAGQLDHEALLAWFRPRLAR